MPRSFTRVTDLSSIREIATLEKIPWLEFSSKHVQKVALKAAGVIYPRRGPRRVQRKPCFYERSLRSLAIITGGGPDSELLRQLCAVLSGWILLPREAGCLELGEKKLISKRVGLLIGMYAPRAH